MWTIPMSGRLACAVLCWLMLTPAWAAPAWPTVALPRDAHAYPVGEEMSVNGMPMRIQGFVSRKSVGELAAWFRSSMGKPLVENIVGPKLVLGKRQGDHFMTVQLETLNDGRGTTRGTVAVTNVRQAKERREENRAAAERLLQRLPSGSRLLSQMNSTDGGKLSSLVMAENGHSEELNRDRLIEQMRDDGLALEREARRDERAMQAGPAALAGGRTLFFKGKGKEAMAVIRPGAPGRTTIVLNTINQVEQFK